MADYKPKNPFLYVQMSHPGEILKELLQEDKIKFQEIINYEGLNREFIDNIIAGALYINEGVAFKLSLITDLSSEFWLGRQQNYDKYFGELRDKSRENNIESDCPMVSFFYLLMRDELVPGKVESIMRNIGEGTTNFTNKYLAEYAINIVERLRENK